MNPKVNRSLELSRFSKLLDLYPAGFRGNPLNLLLVQDAWPITDGMRYLRDLDGLSLMTERREFFVGSPDRWPFPVHDFADRPDPWAVSESLFSDFARASALLKKQSDIAELLAGMANPEQVDVVALMIVDGLSYYDLPESYSAEPCLVDGVTITEFGYVEVVGRPPVSQRLFNKGFRSQVGLTYYDRDANSLAAELYAPFGSSQVRRVRTLEEGLQLLTPRNLPRGFVQYTAPGLDSLCHHHQDRPPIEEYKRQILDRFSRLFEALQQGGRRVLACLTADHGILWRDLIEGKEQVVLDIPSEDAVHPRYVLGSLLREYAQPRRLGGRTYSLLKAPVLTRRLKHTEWGVHGGVSAWESLVPLVIRRSS